MIKKTAFVVVAALLVPQVVFAQSADVQDIRIITIELIKDLSSGLNQLKRAHILKTEELKKRLSGDSLPTSILVFKSPPGSNDIIWFTDAATTHPRSISVSSVEYDLLWALADSGLSEVLEMLQKKATTVFESKIDEHGKVTVVAVHSKPAPPSDAEIFSATKKISEIRNKDVAAIAQISLGARCAEWFPLENKVEGHTFGISVANDYRKSIFQDAMQTFNQPGAKLLPAFNEPVTYGPRDIDAATIIGAVNRKDAVPLAFVTPDGRFDAVWDKSTLIILRRKPEDHELHLNERWVKAFDASHESHFKAMTIDKFRQDL